MLLDIYISSNFEKYMAGVDKFGAAFAIGFMVLMLAFMGSLTPNGESPEIYVAAT